VVLVQNRFDEQGHPLIRKYNAGLRCRSIVETLQYELRCKGRLVKNDTDIHLDALTPAGMYQFIMEGEICNTYEHVW
jgi:hypothetical protein